VQQLTQGANYKGKRTNHPAAASVKVASARQLIDWTIRAAIIPMCYEDAGEPMGQL